MTSHYRDRATTGILALALLAVAGGQAQVTFDCRLTGADTVLTTGPAKKCLDLTALDGKTVTIPSNVSRIDNSGFSLCESSEQSGGLADIVYVMDQSGSMGINYIWISPDLKDTVFLESTSGCTSLTNADANGRPSITIPNGTGVRQVPVLNPNKPITGCRSFAGDPYTQRGVAFREAIDFQAARAPKSTAGFMGFANDVLTPIRPLELSSAANINRIKNAINPSLSNNTNYRAPLDTAKRWLLNPALSPNPTKAVIFVSDGLPTAPSSNPDSYLDVLSATYPAAPGTMPPVYGIFMGKPKADTAKLYDMSQRTGGQFFLIPPDRPDSLKAVVERILNVILRQYQPNSAVVTNNGVVPAQTGSAGPGDFVRQPDGSWLMNLDKAVGLKTQAPNPIDFKTTLIDVQSGTLQPHASGFTLSTTGPEESTNRNLAGTQFGVICVDLPPPINPVKVAYIRDTDGDGAGDKVFFVFTRPLAALPSGIDTLYWNQVAPGYLNSAKPVLSFLPASGNTVVIADLTGSPFKKGLTSIPDPARPPVGVLPAGGIFGGQRPPIADSIGPILDSAFIFPFDNSKVRAGSNLNMDTILVHVSEPMRTENTWTNLLVWSKSTNGKCSDYEHALPLVPSGQPTPQDGSRTFKVIVPTGTGVPTPLAGDCIYLNTSGSYTDFNLNVPPVYGVPLKGPRPPREIELFRGYPPVAGMAAQDARFVVINNDPRKGTDNDYSAKDTVGQFGKPGAYVTVWIPPVDYRANTPYNPVIPPISTRPAGTETQEAVPLPDSISTVQVVSTSKYIVDVTIYDNNGNFVRKFRQKFGFDGELNNRARIYNRGLVSYLLWDMRDYKGQKAGQGVFIWKAIFQFDGNKQEVQYTKTGVIRKLRR